MKRKITILCFIHFFVQMTVCYANQGVSFLKTEQAFELSVIVDDADNLKIIWQIAPEYYLYQNSLNIELISRQSPKHAQLPLTLPQTKIIDDPFFGEQRIYENQLELSVPPERLKDVAPIGINIHYQGCAAAGLCYPPETKTFRLTWDNQTIKEITPTTVDRLDSFAKEALVEAQAEPGDNIISDHLNQSFLHAMLAFLGLGFLLSFTPCVLPMLPILSTVIVGQQQRSYRKGFLLSLCYTLSMSLVLALLGVLAVGLGKNLSVLFQQTWIICLFAGLFIYLGLVQLGFAKLHLPSGMQNSIHALQSSLPAGSYLNAFVMGALATLIASPCVSAPLVGALSYMAQTDDYVLGFSALFCLGLGMGFMLVIAGTLGNHFFPRAGRWMHFVNKLFASMMFALSIWLLSRALSPTIIAISWGIWCLVNAYLLGAFTNLHQLPSRIGMIFVIPAVLLFGFVMIKEPNPVHKLIYAFSNTSLSSAIAGTSYQAISSTKELNDFVLMAQSQNKPTLIKAYADWCTTCQHNEKAIFDQTAVQQALNNWQLLVIDMTKMAPSKQELLNHLNIYGPPAILFITADGEELTNQRIIGKSTAAQFLQALHASEPQEKNNLEN